MTEEQSAERWRVFGECCRRIARMQLIEDRTAVLRALGALGAKSVEMMAKVEPRSDETEVRS